jgi:hypothetical protein
MTNTQKSYVDSSQNYTANQNGHPIARTVVAEPPLQEKSVSSSSPESPQVHVTIEVEETARL